MVKRSFNMAKVLEQREEARLAHHEALIQAAAQVVTERQAIAVTLAGCHYLDWHFDLLIVEDEQFVEAVYPPAQHGQPLAVALGATTAEIVLTAWRTVVAAVEHEARLAFTYRNDAICHPSCGILVI